MARTQEGATLTEQHRAAQMQVRAQALRDFALIWPLWQTAEPASFGSLVTASIPLIRAYHRVSSSLAAAYYGAFRQAESVPGVATPRLAPAVVEKQVTTSLYVTGKVTADRARAAGASPAVARERALVAASGAVTRHVLAGGRDTIIASATHDPAALGWARVTDGDPCAFCALLAGRGPVFKSRETAGFDAHDHCGCEAEPFYRGADWPGRAREYRDLYDRSIREALDSGYLIQVAGVNGPKTIAADPENRTSNDLLNTFRRAYDAQRAAG